MARPSRFSAGTGIGFGRFSFAGIQWARSSQDGVPSLKVKHHMVSLLPGADQTEAVESEGHLTGARIGASGLAIAAAVKAASSCQRAAASGRDDLSAKNAVKLRMTAADRLKLARQRNAL